MITLTREEAQVPLVEQLESVPQDARLCIDDADGMGTHYFPIGNMCHEAAKAIRAKLAQETPYEIGKRLYQEGKGISFIPTAVPHDDNIAEALRGFENARVAQPEPPCKNGSQCIGGKCTQCAQPEPEPVAWMDAPERIYLQVCDDENCDLSFEAHDDVSWCQDKINDCDILYVRSDTAQPQREWVDLTEDEFYDLDDVGRKMILEYGRLVEAKLREKNT